MCYQGYTVLPSASCEGYIVLPSARVGVKLYCLFYVLQYIFEIVGRSKTESTYYLRERFRRKPYIHEDSVKNKKKMLNNLPDVMDVQQMSDFLGISSKTGYKLIKEGTVNHLKIGRFIKVPKIHLLTYLNSCCADEKQEEK